MKRMFLVMAIAIVTILQVSAQNNNNRQMTAQQRTEQRIKMLDEKLSLTEEQKTKIRELYADFNKQKYPREKRKEAMEKLTADISLLLTSEQQATYKQWWNRQLLKRRTENVTSQKNEKLEDTASTGSLRHCRIVRERFFSRIAEPDDRLQFWFPRMGL